MYDTIPQKKFKIPLDKAVKMWYNEFTKGKSHRPCLLTEETAWDTPQAEKSKEGVMTIPA